MRDLFGKFVLFLIRPAIEQYAAEQHEMMMAAMGRVVLSMSQPMYEFDDEPVAMRADLH